MKAQPLISVIIPLPDHRGMAVEVIKNWRQNQAYPDDDFEIIVVSDTANPPLEAEIQPYLAPHDSLLLKPGENIPSLINSGVQKAAGDLLFITESHCLPQPDCLTQIQRYFDAHNIDVACCSSDGINKNLLAQMEQRIFDEDFAKRCQPNAWNKITVRGFAIKRLVFLESGGFESQYGHFSEPVFGAHLHHLGYRMGYVSEAKVSHYNNFNLKYLLPNLIEYGEDEIHYRITGNQNYCERYFHSCPAWQQRELIRKNNARQLYRTVIQHFLRGFFQRNFIRKTKVKQLKFLIKNLPLIVLGSHWNLLKAGLIIRLSQLKLMLHQKDPETYFRVYRRLWMYAIEYGRYKAITAYLNSHPTPPIKNDYSTLIDPELIQ